MNSQIRALFFRLKNREKYQNIVAWLLRCLGPESKELDLFLGTIKKCLDASIDPECLIEAGYMLANFNEYNAMQNARKESGAILSGTRMETPGDFHGPEGENCIHTQSNAKMLHPIVFDEKIEFSLIYQNNLFCKISIQDSLRDYFFRQRGRFPDSDEFSSLRMRYYHFCNRMYTERTLTNIYKELKKDTKHSDIVIRLQPIVDIAQTTPKHHIFYLWHNGYYATMVYKKTGSKYILLAGSVISKKFTNSAKRESAIVDKWMAENILTSIGNDVWRLNESRTVHSSSQAASIVKGTRISGMKIWVNHFKETLQGNLKEKRRKLREAKKRGPGRPRKSS